MNQLQTLAPKVQHLTALKLDIFCTSINLKISTWKRNGIEITGSAKIFIMNSLSKDLYDFLLQHGTIGKSGKSKYVTKDAARINTSRLVF